MIKIIINTTFMGTIETNDSGIIINVSSKFSKFINQPLSKLEEVLKKQKGQSFKIEDVEEITS
jgi:hypothetical protein